MGARVVHIHDEHDIRIDRQSKFGNPFVIGLDGDRDEVCDKYCDWLNEWIKDKKEIIVRGRSNKWIVEHLSDLKGQRIACWCSPKRCHGGFLVKLVNTLFKE